jgi:energy-coupling factor transporter ATP-binding protein EcfA2
MLRAIGVVIAAVATFAFLVSTQDITVEAKPSESITIDGLSPQGGSTLAVACSTFLEPCKVMNSQTSRKTVEAKPSESITIDGLSPQGESTLAEERTHAEMMWGLSPQGESTLAEERTHAEMMWGLSPQGESTLAEERTHAETMWAEMVGGLKE